MCIGPTPPTFLPGISLHKVAFTYRHESVDYDICNEQVLRCLQEMHMSTFTTDYECVRLGNEIVAHSKISIFCFINQFWNQLMEEKASRRLESQSEARQVEACSRVRFWTSGTRKAPKYVDLFCRDCIILPVSFNFVSKRNVYTLILCSCVVVFSIVDVRRFVSHSTFR